MAYLGDHWKRTKGAKARTSPRVIAKAELAAQCLKLRREGLTLDEIARRVSVDGSSTVDEQTVSLLIQGALRELVRPAAEDLRLQELDNLERIYNRSMRIGLSDKARDRVPALNTALKAMERRAALMGLDAPKQVDIKDERQHTPAEAAKEAVLDQLAAEAGEEE